MNPDPAYLRMIADTVRACQDLMSQGSRAAVISALTPTGSLIYVCHDYWTDSDHNRATDFEGSVAAEVWQKRGTHAVIASPLILNTETQVWRPLDERPVSADEVEQVFAVSIDLSDGLDIHRSLVLDRSTRPLAFGPIETLSSAGKLDPAAPGYVLTAVLAAGQSQPTPPTEETP